MNWQDSIALGFFLLGIVGLLYWSARTSSRNRQRQSAADGGRPGIAPVAEERSAPLSIASRFPPVTTSLIVVSAVIALWSKMGSSIGALSVLLIAGPDGSGLGEILSGEVWRLITPIFIHFSLLHLLFNMMWLWDLGVLVERNRGYWFLASFVFAVGIAANLAQYAITRSPFFGGMSGVVYGLLGYVWMQGRSNPTAGLVLHKQTVVVMLGWFFLCWFGFVGPIANWAHTIGLGMGMIWGVAQPRKAVAE
jgi:membrane associated rhomboid family serine protease